MGLVQMEISSLAGFEMFLSLHDQTWCLASCFAIDYSWSAMLACLNPKTSLICDVLGRLGQDFSDVLPLALVLVERQVGKKSEHLRVHNCPYAKMFRDQELMTYYLRMCLTKEFGS